MATRPTRFGRLVVERRLRAVDRTEFYAAYDELLQRRVLVRVIDIESTSTARRFLTDVRALALLSHPHLARIVDFGFEDGKAWSAHLVDPDGTPLSDVIAAERLPSLADRVALLADVLRAVARTHGSGVVVPFTPSDIWVTPDQRRWEFLACPTSDGSAFSGSGMRVGVEQLAYAAPEVLAGEPSTSASQVFASGIVAYETLAGAHPFAGRDPTDAAARIRAGIVPPVLTLGTPYTQVCAAIATAMARSPAGRLDSVHALAAVFEDARQGPLNETTAAWVVSDRTANFAGPPVAEGHSRSAAASPVYDENVQFTVFRPRNLRPAQWASMLVFAHLDALPADASPDEPSPVEQVQAQARSLLGEAHHHAEHTVDSSEAVPREGTLTIVPWADGIAFNPPSATFQWVEAVHREEFRLRPDAHCADSVVRGRVSIYCGSIILAEVPLALRVDTTPASEAAASSPQHTRTYRHVFASYSHRDHHIVEEFSRYAQAMGDRYLRDLLDLRAGEQWGPALERLIREADVFQLFWSWNALHSPYVRHEWQYALSLGRDAFIRPVYWSEPLPAGGGMPPPELLSLHFERIRPLSLDADTDPMPTGSLPPIVTSASRSTGAGNEAEVSSAAADQDAQSPAGAPRPRLRTMTYAGTAAAAVILAAVVWPVVKQQMIGRGQPAVYTENVQAAPSTAPSADTPTNMPSNTSSAATSPDTPSSKPPPKAPPVTTPTVTAQPGTRATRVDAEVPAEPPAADTDGPRRQPDLLPGPTPYRPPAALGKDARQRTAPYRSQPPAYPTTPPPGGPAPEAAVAARYEAGRRALDDGRFAEAERAFAVAVSLDPDFRDAAALLERAREGMAAARAAALAEANALEAGGDWIRAVAAYERAGASDEAAAARVRMRAAGDDAYRAAVQFDARGRTSDAVTWYERAVQWLAEDDPRKATATARLSALKGGAD